MVQVKILHKNICHWNFDLSIYLAFKYGRFPEKDSSGFDYLGLVYVVKISFHLSQINEIHILRRIQHSFVDQCPILWWPILFYQ